MKDESFDVIVVGGGLGGAAAASVLSRAGFEVLVLERETAFRDRVRGEWLASWGILELDAGADWSPAAFATYREERRERMRRLRFASAGNYLFNGFGPDGVAKRRRLRERYAANPASSPLASALLGAWVLPEDAYSPAAWDALVAA